MQSSAIPSFRLGLVLLLATCAVKETESIQRADLPMMQAIVLVLSIFYILLTFLADLLNAFLDPRIRVG